MIYQEIYAGLRSLWRLAVSTPKKTRLMLAKALLMPHFDYCCKIFSYGLDSTSMKLLNKAFHSIVRYVRKYDSILSVDRFLGVDLVKPFRFRAMSFIYRLVTSKALSI